MGKRIKRIIEVSTIVASLLIVFIATTNANTSLGIQKPTDAFTTTVTGVATNAVNNPITINGNSYTTHNIQNYLKQSDNCGTVSISASNFVPSDYVQFAVTITNTGTDTLVFQPFTYSFYFVTSSGHIINPPYPAPVTGYPAPINPSPAQPWTLASFGTDSLSNYLVKLSGSKNWVMDFSYTNGATLPSTLAPGATFTYNLYAGLGSNVPYGIPSCFFSLSIPLTSSTVPTPTPTCTPKPTQTPCPTHTPCPTPTQKPTPTPTCTPKPTSKPTSCPTPTPKPTQKPTPTQTCPPKPTPKPTPKPYK